MMQRGERDLLRRFLFIMMYRNKNFHGRFNVSKENYNADDRAEMMEYMDRKGFKKPIDVWFSNINAFIDVKIDRNPMAWNHRIVEQASLGDALWFWKNITMHYLAFCTPEDPEDEFILSENSYGVFEGLNSSNKLWTDFHLFAPVTPKLMIILRSNMLPRRFDDEDPDRCEKVEVRP